MADCEGMNTLRKNLDNWRKWSGEWEAKANALEAERDELKVKAKGMEAENAKLRERIGKIISLRDGGW